MTRLLLVEDHHALRKGLALLLGHNGCEIVGAVADSASALRVAGETRPDVALVDVHLAAESGIALTRDLIAALPGLAVVLYTGSEDDGLLREGLEAGASGYALKTGEIHELLDAIRAVQAGRRYVDPRLRAAPPLQRQAASLSKREAQVMDMLASGLTGEQVAERLVLSSETVKTHVRNAMGKLEASTRVHAVALALRDGHISPPRALVGAQSPR